MIERFEHELAARAQPGRRTERAVPVQNRGRDTPIVDPEPRAAREEIETGNNLGAVRPVPTRRLGRTVDHLVAISADDDRPFMFGPAQDNESAHAVVGVAPKGGTFRLAIGPRYCQAI